MHLGGFFVFDTNPSKLSISLFHFFIKVKFITKQSLTRKLTTRMRGDAKGCNFLMREDKVKTVKPLNRYKGVMAKLDEPVKRFLLK